MFHNVLISDEGYAGLNPVQFGYEDCKPCHSYGPAIRTHWLLHFVVSGFGCFTIENKTYKISPGEMFVIPPYVETYYKADKEHPWHYIWIGFTTNEPLPVQLAEKVCCPEALSVFDDMKNCTEFSTGRSAFLCARLWDLFALLAGRETPREDYIKKALDCIHSEYMNHITVEEIADRLNLDRTYFSVLFKRTIGKSPKQYLLDFRLNTAATLLVEQKVSVSVAAISVGYSDIYTFSKMFKQRFGIPPKEYRVNNIIPCKY